MRGLIGALTVRGRSFVAAGAAAIVCGLLIPEPDLIRIGALLLALPRPVQEINIGMPVQVSAGPYAGRLQLR